MNDKNKNDKEQKNILITFVIPALIVITLFLGYIFMTQMTKLNKAYSDMNSIEFLSSSTQRLISLHLTDQLIPKDIYFIGTTTEAVLQVGSETALSVFESNPELVELANTVYESWISIEEMVQSEDPDDKSIALYREAHFKAMTDLSNGIKIYSEDLNQSIAQYQTLIMILLSGIALIMLMNLLNTHNKLKLSADLAQMAQIDVATGLFNRSRCQEIFKNNKNISNLKHPAILVIDLNDLKKANDSLGHRVGDELISNFAKLLKDACEVNIESPFIGRYGGDEFIVYYEDIQNVESVEVYLKELAYLTEEANEIENRFKISYAVGYSYVDTTDDEELTIKDLFDKADEDMYKNKVAMKREKNPNYDEQVAKGEDVR